MPFPRAFPALVCAALLGGCATDGYAPVENVTTLLHVMPDAEYRALARAQKVRAFNPGGHTACDAAAGCVIYLPTVESDARSMCRILHELDHAARFARGDADWWSHPSNSSKHC